MKLNIEVDLTQSPYGGISISLSNVPAAEYKKIKKSDIDDVLCKAVEVAYKAVGWSQAEAMAEAICYGTLKSQSTCQEYMTTPTSEELDDISQAHQ